jgi:pimeloyl-ACP methyl ester carboxylesterase
MQRCANRRDFSTLMGDVLDYRRFAAQGGDWGGYIAAQLGAAHANRVLGIHVNLLWGPRDAVPEPRTDEERAYVAELKHWLQEEEAYGVMWRPAHGTRVAKIGPLSIVANENYSAQYMDAIFTPGMTAPAHIHSGPEAWHTVAGETCLETSDGRVQVGRAVTRQ